MIKSLIAYLLSEATVTSIVGTKIFPVRAPQSEVVPFVIVRLISRMRHPHSGGKSGLVTSRVQVDCYGETYKQAEQLAAVIQLLLDGREAGEIEGTFVRSIFCESEQDIDEGPQHGESQGDTRRTQDFIVTHREAVA